MISCEDKVGAYTFVSVSDVGFNHCLSHMPNQDAAMYEVSGKDFVIAVSDGVGSCPKAELGSRTAVEVMRKTFVMLKAGTLPGDLDCIVKTVIEAWKEQLCHDTIDDYCATLKAAIKIDNRLLLISIGDGMLAATSEGMSICAPADNDLFANQTGCLNEKVKPDDFWFSSFDLDTYVPYVVFACTDGVANGIEAGRELDLVRELEFNVGREKLREEIETFVVSLSEYSSDDRTVGVVKYEGKNAEALR